MIKCFQKELKLNVAPPMYLFTLLAAMVLIPNYPVIVGAGYVAMQIQVYLQNVSNNRSLEFSTMLPVRRKDITGGITLVIVLFQMLNVVLALALIPVAKTLYPQGNLVGIDANLTFTGITLFGFGIFNLVFLTGYFKTGRKYGWPLVYATLTFLLVYGVFETLIQVIPTLTAALDGYSSDYTVVRLALAMFGLIFYAATTALANKLASEKFEKVNL